VQRTYLTCRCDDVKGSIHEKEELKMNSKNLTLLCQSDMALITYPAPERAFWKPLKRTYLGTLLLASIRSSAEQEEST
jgi:hypothetical protein